MKAVLLGTSSAVANKNKKKKKENKPKKYIYYSQALLAMYADSSAFYSSEHSASFLRSQFSDANLSESDVENGSPTKLETGAPPRIDYTKYKTKYCRNYVMGFRCPFEDRCAFAHGPYQVRAAPPPPPPSYSEAVTEALVSVAPPPYSALVASDSPSDSRPPSPPQYPTKYRFDPYTTTGVRFEN